MMKVTVNKDVNADAKLLLPDEALAVVLRHAEPLGGEIVELSAAFLRVLRTSVAAEREQALPPWDNSAMDGYAVRAADVVPGRPLPVRAVVAAGHPATTALTTGTAMRILTGAPLPAGADAVIMREEAEERDGQVRFTTTPAVGQHLRRAGEDIAAGEQVLAAGAVIHAGEIGLLAALGRTLVEVYRRPTVAIVSTGDELVYADRSPELGQIVNSNAHALSAQVVEAGGLPRVLPIAGDSPAALQKTFAEALRADVIVSSGGVSVGEFDYVREVLQKLHGIEEFSRVAMKPGKPLTFSRFPGASLEPGRSVLCFGLPGNPASAMVSFELFVRPALRRLQGHAETSRPRVKVQLLASLMPDRSRQHFARVRVVRQPAAESEPGAAPLTGGELVAYVPEKQGSGMLRSMVGYNALLHVPPGAASIPAGTLLPATLLAPV
jgi:molybdopterin molybdotransferase